MKILLTGANGYLGHQIHQHLLTVPETTVLATSHRPNKDVVACNLCDMNAVQALYQQFSPDIIIHTAAIVPKNLEEYQDKSVQNLNMVMLENILKDYQGRFIFCSSMTVYSEKLSMPVSENDANGQNLSSYGLNKYQSEKYISENKNASKWLALRFPGIFGFPRKNGLIYNLIRHYKYGDPIWLPQSPLLWAGIHIDDLVDIITHVTLDKNVNGIMNISYDYTYSLNDLNELLAEISGKSPLAMMIHPEFRMDLKRLHAIVPQKKSFKNALEGYYRQC